MNSMNRLICIFCFLFFTFFSFLLLAIDFSLSKLIFCVFLFFLYIIFPAILSFIILQFIIYRNDLFSLGSNREFLEMGDHINKKTISSMGGIAFIIVNSIYFIYIYFTNQIGIGYLQYSYLYVFIMLASIFSGLVGLWDDLNKKYLKKGISVSQKFIVQGLCALISSIYLYLASNRIYSNINLGFFNLNIGCLYPLWAAFVIISTSHAVNLTDGIDGLAMSQALTTLISFIVSLLINLSNLDLLLGIICIIFFLTFLPYLYFNLNKAKILMGDSGSLFLGTFLASIFLVRKIEILLIFSGIVFVLETLLVIFQVIYFKIYRERLFSFTPIHHALEKIGYSENKIVILFFGISLFGQLIMLKLIKYFI